VKVGLVSGGRDAEDVLDTIVAVETPEGIQLELRPAGLTARGYALIVDWGIRLAALYSVGTITSVMGGVGMGVWLVLLFAAEWLYPVCFELTAAGATPGKRLFNLRVVMDNGLPVTPAAALTRNLLRSADFLPFAYGFAIVSLLVRSDNKRLGDLAAGTLVVSTARPDIGADDSDVPALAPARGLSLPQQAAVIGLAGRAGRLTPERLNELATIAASVSGDSGSSGPLVTRRVLGVARWALGHRP
jgi:uncharacterized RDD family membrane protein YckC